MPVRSPIRYGMVFSMTVRIIAACLLGVCLPFPSHSQMPSRSALNPEMPSSARSRAGNVIDRSFEVMKPFLAEGLIDQIAFLQGRKREMEWGGTLVLVKNKTQKSPSKPSETGKKGRDTEGSPAKEDPAIPLEALDLFYARLGESFQQKPSADAEVNSTRITGIRYSFIRETGFNQEEELGDATKISDDLRNVRLAIEPNREGFLYVLAPVGKSKWQLIRGQKGEKRKDKLGPAHVRAFQTVEFGLGAIANRFGKPVVDLIHVVLSPSKLEHPSRELKDNPRFSGLMTETLADSIFIVQPEDSPERPFLAKIPF